MIINFSLTLARRQAVNELVQPLKQEATAAPRQPHPTSYVIESRDDVIKLQQAAAEEFFLLPQESR